ncbi:hypothetical protein FQR65_LT13377 [Abscondita terminalis]|nr:hypothetical protein FQR65_LT13377 [Abscondita terminalis]
MTLVHETIEHTPDLIIFAREYVVNGNYFEALRLANDCTLNYDNDIDAKVSCYKDDQQYHLNFTLLFSKDECINASFVLLATAIKHDLLIWGMVVRDQGEKSADLAKEAETNDRFDLHLSDE